MPPARTPEEIRNSIEQNRDQLGTSLGRLRQEVVRVTDWRGQLRRHRTQAAVGAFVVGFVVGGGLAALGTLAAGGRGSRR